jgi:hypothetical protein
MTARRVASVLSVLGGAVWIGAALVGWGGDSQEMLYLLGLVLFVLAFAALGYSLVASAPVWLRAVVTVATPALGYMVWVTVRDAFATDSVVVLAAGVVLLVAGGIGFTRRGHEEPPTVARGGHRALR